MKGSAPRVGDDQNKYETEMNVKIDIKRVKKKVFRLIC
jgi:hypothetical protein